MWVGFGCIPSLTPECYNRVYGGEHYQLVVVPSLTPECYNRGGTGYVVRLVVVPSLTPECYNQRKVHRD